MRYTLLLAIIFIFPVLAAAQTTEALQVFETAVADSLRGEDIDALEGFQKTLTIIERDPASTAFTAKVQYNIGVSLYRLGLLQEATSHLETALRISKNHHAKAFYVLGLAKLELNELDDATSSLRSAVVLDNRNGDAWYDLGRAYLAMNDGDNAKRAFAKALKNGVSSREPRGHAVAIQPLPTYE